MSQYASTHFIERCMVNGLSDDLLKELRECIGLGIDNWGETVLEEEEIDPKTHFYILTEADVDVLLLKVLGFNPNLQYIFVPTYHTPCGNILLQNSKIASVSQIATNHATIHTITHSTIDSVHWSEVAPSNNESETFAVTPVSTRLITHASQTFISPVNSVSHKLGHQHITSPQIANVGVIQSQSTALFEPLNIAETPPSVSN